MFSSTVSVRKNTIRRKIRGVKAASDDATDRAAKTILREAQSRARIGKKRAIVDGLTIVEMTKGDSDRTVAVGVWGVKEASFIENGTAHNRAWPYLRPAANVGRRELKREAEQAINRECASET